LVAVEERKGVFQGRDRAVSDAAERAREMKNEIRSVDSITTAPNIIFKHCYSLGIEIISQKMKESMWLRNYSRRHNVVV